MFEVQLIREDGNTGPFYIGAEPAEALDKYIRYSRLLLTAPGYKSISARIDGVEYGPAFEDAMLERM